MAIRYGYTQFPEGTNEKQALSQIILDAAAKGNMFISDADSRPLGSAHPKAHLWDNGANALDELERLLKVRAAALDRFGENSIPIGEPWAKLDETLVPLYFLHRYQTEAAAKSLGGVDYTYALKGDGQTITRIVAARRATACAQAATADGECADAYLAGEDHRSHPAASYWVSTHTRKLSIRDWFDILDPLAAKPPRD